MKKVPVSSSFHLPSHFGFSPWPYKGQCPFGSCCLCQLFSARAALLLWLILLFIGTKCRTVTSGQSSSLPDCGVEVVQREGNAAQCGGKLMSPSTAASSPLRTEVIGGSGYIFISLRSLLPSSVLIQWFKCWPPLLRDCSNSEASHSWPNATWIIKWWWTCLHLLILYYERSYTADKTSSNHLAHQGTIE